MLDRQLRVVKERVMIPVADGIGKYAHPNTLTAIGFGFGIAAGVAAYQCHYVPALILWIINRIFDGLDGTVARQYNKKSDIGAYLDILLDHATYTMILLGLAFGTASWPVMMAALFLMGAFYINGASWMYLSSILERRQQGAAQRGEMTGVTMPDGLIEGTETVIIYTLFFLLPQYLTPLFVLMGVLVLITIGQRFLWAIQHLD